MAKTIRRPAVAGQFYPADPSRLEFKVKEYLNLVETSPPALSFKQGEGAKVRAVMVPHAGYEYSAGVAAHSYVQLAGRKIDTLVIIGNAHSEYFNGIAIDNSDAWATPLGDVPVDHELAGKLVAPDNEISLDGSAHRGDHTLEVQLPFLQVALDRGFKIVPVLFGDTDDESYKALAKSLAENLGDNDLVVISSDMSHYPSYEDANRIDRATLEHIKGLDITGLNGHVAKTMAEKVGREETLLCGIDGVKTVMELARLRGWDQTEILKYANSGDTPGGDKSRVVGYGAVAFAQVKSSKLEVPFDKLRTSKSENELNDEQKKMLLDIAKQTVDKYVRENKVPEFNILDDRLNWKEGAFVTLHKDAELRGCIGQIIPSDDALWEVVRDMAVAAATEDDRFDPVRAEELPFLDIEVSVLSRPEKIDKWQDITLGVHGVIVKNGYRAGVFLPQVATETGWSLDEFLGQLCAQKAGLPAECYKDGSTILQVFTAQVFDEEKY
jgi:AmmeMemoRadiSam system protein B/AmmeMemoRadiSam system protein A